MDAVVAEVGGNHQDGDLGKPHMRGKFHGFGYRTMCRFYGGLVFHSPLVREFDYYWRVDGGDSRITWKDSYDLFASMQNAGKRYGYRGIAKSGPSPALDMALEIFDRRTRTLFPTATCSDLLSTATASTRALTTTTTSRWCMCRLSSPLFIGNCS